RCIHPSREKKAISYKGLFRKLKLLIQFSGSELLATALATRSANPFRVWGIKETLICEWVFKISLIMWSQAPYSQVHTEGSFLRASNAACAIK
ncbi:hypothetical protein LINPERHAP2_LOCUS12990, partial [Linum perenne]